MKNLINRAITTICLILLAGQAGVSIAADSSESKFSSDDLQAVFETLIYRSCQKQIKPMLDKFLSEISQIGADESIEKRICGCTTNVASKGQRMKAIFAQPPEKLKDISSDAEASSYIKGKLVSSMLQCMGYHIDALLDPRPNQKQ